MTQSEAANLLGIDHLFRYLATLGSDIEIVVKDSTKQNKPGHMKVAVA